MFYYFMIYQYIRLHFTLKLLIDIVMLCLSVSILLLKAFNLDDMVPNPVSILVEIFCILLLVVSIMYYCVWPSPHVPRMDLLCNFLNVLEY